MRARVAPCGWEIVLRTGNKAMPASQPLTLLNVHRITSSALGIVFDGRSVWCTISIVRLGLAPPDMGSIASASRTSLGPVWRSNSAHVTHAQSPGMHGVMCVRACPQVWCMKGTLSIWHLMNARTVDGNGFVAMFECRTIRLLRGVGHVRRRFACVICWAPHTYARDRASERCICMCVCVVWTKTQFERCMLGSTIDVEAIQMAVRSSASAEEDPPRMVNELNVADYLHLFKWLLICWWSTAYTEC